MHVANTRKSGKNSQPVPLNESPSLHFSSNLFACLVMASHFHMEVTLQALFGYLSMFFCHAYLPQWQTSLVLPWPLLALTFSQIKTESKPLLSANPVSLDRWCFALQVFYFQPNLCSTNIKYLPTVSFACTDGKLYTL